MIATSAGTSSVRTMTASMRTPKASAVAIIWTTMSGAVLSEANEIARTTVSANADVPTRLRWTWAPVEIV